MTRHKDSPAFIEYLQTVIPNFIEQLKTYINDVVDKGLYNSDPEWMPGYTELELGFQALGELFANLDEDFSELEAAFIWDILVFLNPNEGVKFAHLDNSAILKYCLNSDTKSFHSSVISFLNNYDAENQTNVVFQAKIMFFEYANAVCKADGLPLSRLQKETLSNFKDQLFKDDFFDFDISSKEYRHENSAKFIDYLETTIADLTPPLEEMEREIEGTDDPDGRASISLELWSLGRTFAYANRRIAESEAAFVTDINNFLDNEEDYKTFDDKYYQNQIYESVTKYSVYNDVSIPSVVEHLQLYDKRNGTDFATQAKSMFFRFANAVAKADGNICEDKQILLSKYKDILFNYELDEEIDEENDSKYSDKFRVN